MSINTKQIKNIILVLNLLNKDKPKLEVDRKSLKKYSNGLIFINETLWKISLIFRNQYLKKIEKIELLQLLPDPNGKRFINKKLAKWIYYKRSKLNKLYEILPINSLTGGSLTTTRDKIFKIVITPLQLVEDNIGLGATVPLEWITLIVSNISTTCMLISSTMEILPLPTPIGWVPDTIGDILLGIHALTSLFIIFLSVSRAKWDLAIQSALGLFPQFLESMNGLTKQLTLLNNFINVLSDTSLLLISESKDIIHMIKPMMKNPLYFLNPIVFKSYVFHSIEILAKTRKIDKKALQAKLDTIDNLNTSIDDIKKHRDNLRKSSSSLKEKWEKFKSSRKR